MKRAVPRGWMCGVHIREEDGLAVYFAYAEHRTGLVLDFEATSAVDLVDQVNEAIDAWQTDLEMRAGMATHRRVIA